MSRELNDSAAALGPWGRACCAGFGEHPDLLDDVEKAGNMHEDGDCGRSKSGSTAVIMGTCH